MLCQRRRTSRWLTSGSCSTLQSLLQRWPNILSKSYLPFENQGALANIHRVPARACGGEEDNQPSRKRSWGWSWSRVGEAVFDPSVWFEVSEQVKLVSSGKKDWSFSVVLVRHMGSSFQSTKKYSARPWRNFMKGSRLVDVYKKKFALKVFFPARPRSRE